ncbi:MULTISPECIES: MaoC/PaaZ C-terminal domain-containing protein [Ramlibacter]|uniref:Acyl dehydratase n=1 Tax=Ramlibacter pinisoli TaxID=2682844 RepID=A0A6N8J186_9BURK|nr:MULTISPECIES: MaoC/PaaZ C-terminal domain-containing protein [Ramlibacter]MBA2962663.1 MaoC family dehydratase N-terminal domain-containing protein [Ramlibacter sp. CGMCC 1.13660]MVQ32605.1 acyl dehydratase [Ramlibacter pinisoli]
MSERLLRQIDDYVVAFEDLDVGDTFTTSGRTVTEADVVNFAGLSADYNALHVDAAFAAGTPHQGRIAHGLLVLAISSGLCTRLPVMKFLEPSILGLADLHCRFRRPCKIGDTLKVRMTVTDKQPGRKPDRGTITFSRVAVNQHDEDVMESVWQLVVRTRTGAAA